MKKGMQLTTTMVALLAIALISFLSVLIILSRTITFTGNLQELVGGNDEDLMSLASKNFKVFAPEDQIQIRSDVSYLIPIMIKNIFQDQKNFKLTASCYNESGDTCNLDKKIYGPYPIKAGSVHIVRVVFKLDDTNSNGNYYLQTDVNYSNSMVDFEYFGDARVQLIKT